LRLRFGDCLLDTEARELRLAGSRRELSPKGLQFLELLLEARPRALTKQEIHERLWPDSVVSDSSLARLASEVREAIGDDARHPRLLRTLHRHGYAFSDLGSKNGTLHRGRRIEAPAELADGDEIGVGPVMLLFRAAHGDLTTETGTAR
jgi:DNA-binding winged helix-turn-helix (wHTH) protein